MMRTTAAHSAVLVDGVGHQYHDGMEGTNPSDAVATVVQSRSRARYAVWTSDATQAYALVDADVASVSRTVLVHYPTRAIILVDHLKKDATPSLFSARLFAYNLDGAGSVVAEGSEFRISRPGATLIGSTYSLQGTICTANRLPIPDDRADQHPFVEVSSASAASEVSIVTVLVPSATGTEALGATITATDTGCNVHLGMLTVEVYDQGRIPRLVVRNG